jgi:hypothetical protein
VTEKENTQTVDVDLCREMLARMITRNERNPIIRAAHRLRYLKNVSDLSDNPDRHLAGAISIVERNGPTFEAGLQIGACMVLCAVVGTEHRETLGRMLAEIKLQQDGEKEKEKK